MVTQTKLMILGVLAICALSTVLMGAWAAVITCMWFLVGVSWGVIYSTSKELERDLENLQAIQAFHKEYLAQATQQ
jgi:hypothetical protein